MIFPSVPNGISGENQYPILRVYSRKFTTSDRSGPKYYFTALYVDHYYPRPVIVGKPGPV